MGRCREVARKSAGWGTEVFDVTRNDQAEGIYQRVSLRCRNGSGTIIDSSTHRSR